MILALVLASLSSVPAEVANWTELHSDAALVLEAQPQNEAAWLDFCLSAWRLSEPKLLETCRKNAVGSPHRVAGALETGAAVDGSDRWSSRVRLERALKSKKYDEARPLAQRLYELEPDNRWALNVAILAARRAGQAAMTLALTQRGEERFGRAYTEDREAAEKAIKLRYGGDGFWFFFAGMLILTLVVFRQGRRRRGARRRA